MTITELDLLAELKRARENTGNFAKKISLAQLQAMRTGATPPEAVQQLISGIVRLVNSTNANQIEPYHPLIGALSILINHPAADWKMLSGVEENRRDSVEKAIKERNQSWDADTLEWQLVIYVKALGENAPVDVRSTLAEQEFDDDDLQNAWDVLLQLNFLRMENRL